MSLNRWTKPSPRIASPQAPQPTPEVCPDGDVAQWAQKHFRFTATPIQARVLNEDTKRLALCCNRQWGKSTIIAIKTLHYAVHNPDRTVIVLSRTKHQAALLINKVIQFASLLGMRYRRVRHESHSFQLPNGSRIYAIAHCEDTSVGNTADLLVVDEASRVKDIIFATVAPFVARTNGAIWILSTPRGESGFFYQIMHSRDPRWTRITSTVHDCPDIDPDYLKGQQRLNPDAYEQDFLCKFRPLPGRLASRKRVREMLDPDLDPWHLNL